MLIAMLVPPALVLLLNHSRAGFAVSTLYLLQMLLGTSHQGTTMALYVDRELRPILLADPKRYFVVPVAIIVGAAVAAETGLVPVLIALVTVKTVWTIHHFARQNLGVLAFLGVARGGPSLTRLERRVVDLSTLIGICGGAATLQRHSIEVPGARGVLPWMGLVLLMAGLTVVGRAAWTRELDAPRVAGLVGVLVFFAPLLVYRGNIAIAVLAYSAVHGAQHHVMMTERRCGREARDRIRMILAIIAAFVVVGLPLWYVGNQVNVAPWMFGAAAGAAMAHVVVDAGVWRMREPAQRAYMSRRFDFLSPPPPSGPDGPVADHVGCEPQLGTTRSIGPGFSSVAT